MNTFGNLNNKVGKVDNWNDSKRHEIRIAVHHKCDLDSRRIFSKKSSRNKVPL